MSPTGPATREPTSPWRGSCCTGSSRSCMTGLSGLSGSTPACLDGCRTTSSRIVEVAAGTGRLTLELVHRAREVLAIEPAAPLREILRQKLARAGHGRRRPVCHGFFDDLPLTDDCADLVVACSALTPAPGHGGEAGLAEMERVCRPGGCVVIVWPNHVPWLAAHGYRYVSFDGDDVCRVRQPRGGCRADRDLLSDAVEEVRRRGWRRVQPIRTARRRTAT